MARTRGRRGGGVGGGAGGGRAERPDRDAVRDSQAGRLAACLAALSRHPQLPGDLRDVTDTVHALPPDVFHEAGRNRLPFLSTVAAYDLTTRYRRVWTRAAGLLRSTLGETTMGVPLQQAVLHRLGWRELVRIWPHGPPRRVGGVVSLHARHLDAFGTRLGYAEPLRDHDDIDLGSLFGLGRRATMSIELDREATLDEAVAWLTEAWTQARLSAHLGRPPEPLAGRTVAYALLVDLYAAWYQAHVRQGQATSRFVARVENGDLPVPGWPDPPSHSAIEKRLSAARHWLEPRGAERHIPLADLLGHTVLEGENSMRIVLPDGSDIFSCDVYRATPGTMLRQCFSWRIDPADR